MTPRDRDDRHDGPESEHGLYDDSPPRSIFAATWFRAVLILIVLGVIGAVAVPYILDAVNPPAPKTPVIARPASAPPAPSTTPPPAPPPPADKPTEAFTPAMPAPPATQEAQPTGPKTSPSKTATVTTPSADNARALAKAETTKPDTAKPATKRTAARATMATAAPGGPWWVQVGAFKNEATAKRLVDKLRADNYTVQKLLFTPARAPAATSAGASSTTDQYDVFVSGLPADDINKRLAARGLASQPSGAGVVVTPSLPLREAVALSKALAVEGLKVQVKRAGGAAPTTAVTPPPNGGGMTLYRVRVGGFSDRAAAQAAAKELEAKGYKPFVGRG